MIGTDRRRHAGIEGSGVPDVKAERATKRAAKKTLREAHGACLQAMQTAVRTHAISHDAALAHVLHMAIDDAVPPTGMASALLDLPVGESRSAFPARDALITHAASGLDAARDWHWRSRSHGGSEHSPPRASGGGRWCQRSRD